ncbi:MAG: hypothetical protein E5X67_03360 [Mesorhizobium sp.]|uniref:hypothetical protein n=1 Tax=Mesorhizobium sp. TaxID=1871066 RepID=UPI00121920B7|nr:hypothetical protein [Mesorhizobium sp.]TIP30128.1 MAG: hypothetical protein E5X67_03360 [Mesorhizobium sp.]
MPKFTIAAISKEENFTFLSLESEIVPRLGEHLHLPDQKGIFEVMAIVHQFHDWKRVECPILYVEQSSIDDAIRARRAQRDRQPPDEGARCGSS